MRLRLLTNGRAWMATACAGLVALGIAGFVFCTPGYRPHDYLVRRLEASIGQAPEEEILPLTRRLAELDDAGTGAVVRLLASRRESEAMAAQVVILEQLDRWRLREVEESERRVMHLANELVANLERIPPERQRFLDELATQLLLWPASGPSHAEQLLSRCETILRTGGQEGKETPGDSNKTEAVAIEGPPLHSPPRQSARLPAGDVQ